MPRKKLPGNVLEMHGRRPGVDSGGRPIQAPPTFEKVPPEPPEWLGELARDVWERIVDSLGRLDLLKDVDGPQLEAYCEAYETFVKATQTVHAEGITGHNRHGEIIAHPAVRIQRQAMDAMRLWCAEFGLSPSAEMRLAKGAAGGDSEDNPWSDAGEGT